MDNHAVFPLHRLAWLQGETMVRGAVVAWLMISWSSAVSAAGLDDPIVERPTPRSEIKRGYDAGSACPYNVPLLQLDSCFNRLRDRYRDTHSSTDAYEAGLYFRKWEIADIQKRAYQDLRSRDLAVAEANARVACLEVAGAAEKAGLHGLDVIEALGPAGQVSKGGWSACVGPQFSQRPSSPLPGGNP
jgi:hypothetical protein